MEKQTSVFLAFEGFGSDPTVVTEMVGVEPTLSYGEGEVVQRAGRDFTAPRASWILRSPLEKAAAQEDLIDALLDVLEPHADGVRKATELYVGGIVVGRTSDDHHWGYHLTRRAVQRIAALNLAVDTDIYLWANAR
ncbi:MAG: DUF4279 domain-containing protein [Bacteroidota bacterium]